MELESTPLDTRELRTFGLLTGALFALLFGLALPLLRAHPLPLWPWVVSALLAGTALAWPAGLAGFHRRWTRMGRVLEWINTRLVLTLIFFGVMMPMGLLIRLVRRDPMARRFDPSLKSYRVAKAPRDRKSLERPF